MINCNLLIYRAGHLTGRLLLITFGYVIGKQWGKS